MKTISMACGHTANGTEGPGNIPCCVICAGIGVAYKTPVQPPNLTGRQAKCMCGKTVKSDSKLAFFEFKGEGSRAALTVCKHCGYADVAHDPAYMQQNVPSNRLTVVERGECSGFEPHGPYPFDSYYNGCRGWE